MSSSSVKDQNSLLSSPKSQLLASLNLPRQTASTPSGFSLPQKPIGAYGAQPMNTEEDSSRVNLLALLKQLNQRK